MMKYSNSQRTEISMGFLLIDKLIQNPIVFSIVVFVFILPVSPLFADNHAGDFEISNDDKLFFFSISLFENREYYRAITELNRYMYFYPNGKYHKVSHLIIADSYYRGEKYQEAISEYDKYTLSYPNDMYFYFAYLWKGRALHELGENYQAREIFLSILNDSNELKIRRAAFLNLFCVDLFTQDNIPPKSLLTSPDILGLLSNNDLDKFSNFYEESSKENFKSPLLSGILSTIFPGSGLIYLKKYQEFLIALILNGVTTYSSVELFLREEYFYGGALALLEVGWYGGTIYHSVSSAHKHNYRIKSSRTDKFKILFIPRNKERPWSIGIEGAY
jgi:tetratricopeptide (TPR) repeat protein